MTVPYFSTAGDPFGDQFDDPLDVEASLRFGWSHDVVPPDLADDDQDDQDELNDDDDEYDFELWDL